MRSEYPREARLDSTGLGVVTERVQRELRDWWLSHPQGANTPFTSEEQWRCVALSYLSQVGARELVDQKIPCGETTMQIIIRSRPIYIVLSRA